MDYRTESGIDRSVRFRARRAGVFAARRRYRTRSQKVLQRRLQALIVAVVMAALILINWLRFTPDDYMRMLEDNFAYVDER